MNRLKISATMRLSIGLSFIASTVLFVSYALGMFPDVRKLQVESRLKQCETIAISASIHARKDETDRMEATLRAITSRNQDIESMAIRRANGVLVAEIGDHRVHWDVQTAKDGSERYVLVPVIAGNQKPWGTIEIRFKEKPSGLAGLTEDPYFGIFQSFPAAMALLTYLFLRKMLRQMDPSKAVPSRVRSALDTLTGGLLVLDVKGRIVLANQSFADASGYSPKELQGTPVESLPWIGVDTDADESSYDWMRPIRKGEPQPSRFLSIDHGERRTFLVNCAPIEGEEGKIRGILASFEDVTALKAKEDELQRMLKELTQSREEIRRHNEHLRALAMQDPLTGCMNRRAFFERLEQEWSRADRYEHPLSVVILDLDDFASINEEHGHSAGDMVLKKVGELLSETIRDGDFVCRYGGEEFCIGLTHVDFEDGVLAAERFCREITKAIAVEGRPITASVGVSSMSLGGEHPQALVKQADRAMYEAKRGGRNQVVSFDDVDRGTEFDEAGIPAIQPAGSENDVAIPFHAVTALTSALGYRDAETAEHSRRVADACVKVAGRMMTASDCYTLEIAALLHDIGKIGVPDAILLKPGPLTKEEWDIMGIHDHMGIEIVDSAFNSPALTEVIRCHHACYDGSGRHQNLPEGKEIPLGARILSIADTYDAITSDRVYRKGRSPEEAFAELRRCGGTQFDPDIVEQFIKSMQESVPSQEAKTLEVNKKTALRIGVQIERITSAIDDHDCETLRALLGRLKHTAKTGDAQEIAEAAGTLETAVGEDAELAELVGLTNDLLQMCHSTQQVFLDRQTDTVC